MRFGTIQVLVANRQTLHTGALIYYLRHIIHDYQDSVCINILKHIADALPENEPRARVLICEQNHVGQGHAIASDNYNGHGYAEYRGEGKD